MLYGKIPVIDIARSALPVQRTDGRLRSFHKSAEAAADSCALRTDSRLGRVAVAGFHGEEAGAAAGTYTLGALFDAYLQRRHQQSLLSFHRIAAVHGQ